VPDRKPTGPKSFEEVIYPDKIEKYQLDEFFVAGLADKWNKLDIPKEKVAIPFTGKYLGLPCTQKILEGIPAGKRSFGAQIVSVACKLDGLSEAEAEAVLRAYVKACSHAPSPFPPEEALDWLKWIYKQRKPYWACGNCVKLECCFRVDCDYHKKKYEKEIEVFNNPEPLQVIKEALDYVVVGEDELKMQLFLLYLTKNFHPEWLILIDGDASSGKSHTMKAVASLFGEQGKDWFAYSRMTGAALDHAEDLVHQWEKKIVIIEELQGTSKAVENLRVAISEGHLNFLRAEESKDAEGNKTFSTVSEQIPLDCLFVTCNAEEFDEGAQLLSRAWVVNTDTTPGQSGKVIDYYLDEFSGGLSRKIPNLYNIQTALQFLEIPSRIDFPFAKELREFFHTDSVRIRRDIKKFITLVKACAYFHQKDRVWNKEILYADWRDVYMVFKYAGAAFNASSQGLGAKDIEHYQNITRNMAYVPEFGVDDVQRWCSIPNGTARRLMSTLIGAGLFENKNKPPIAASYTKTTIQPKNFDEAYVLTRCKIKIDKQDLSALSDTSGESKSTAQYCSGTAHLKNRTVSKGDSSELSGIKEDTEPSFPLDDQHDEEVSTNEKTH